MSNNLSLDRIVSSFRQGNDSSYIYSDVLPLFIHDTLLYQRFNSIFRNEFLSALREAGINEEDSHFRWNSISEIIINGVQKNTELKIIENQLLAFYRPLLNPERTIINETVRNDRCFAKVQGHIIGKSVVDYGCGKGLLGAKIESDLDRKVILVDNIDFNKTNLPIVHSDKEGRTSLSEKGIDTSIAYLVLHHMDNPLSGLKELSRISKSRLILMEGYIEKPEYRYINQAIDWFFNRILLGVDMNVPLNFLTLAEWSYLIEQVGFKVSKTEYVGADEKLAPEHHVLIIADRAQ
jgi:ubiquinone/menaquinone biosynthesis C-methylase UbiE